MKERTLGKLLLVLLSLYSIIKARLKNILGLDLRPSTKFFKEYFKDKSLVGIEIGVFKGDNAKRLLKNLKINKLYLIDPYGKLYIKKDEVVSTMEADSEYTEFLEEDSSFDGIVYDFEKAYRFAKNNLNSFNNKIDFIKKRSDNAISDIPDGFDFIYIDGDHSYDSVKKDIELYFPKLRDGGVISGHDFSGEYSGLVKAVIEFSEKNNLKLEGVNYDWWIVKK